MGYKRGQYQAYIGEKLSSRVAPLELLCVRWSESLKQVGPLHLLSLQEEKQYLKYIITIWYLILTI